MTDFSKIPFEDIIKVGQRTLLDRPLFTVSWILGRFCNYNCSYCWPYARSSTPDHFDLNVYLKGIDEIKRQARKNGFTEFHFSFSGGEPTAYKQFNKVLKHYSEDADPEYQSLHMTTNLSPAKKWWEKFVTDTYKLQRKSITASFHAEHADETEFGDKCLMLMDAGVFVTINQVMVPELFNEYYERCQRFFARGINVTLKPQSDPTASYIVGGYTEYQRKILQENFPQKIPSKYKSDIPLLQIELEDKFSNKFYLDQAERFNAFDFNKFQGWSCNSGYQSCIIRSNEVKRSYSCHDESLGTLTDGFELFANSKVCITPSCVSSADSKIPKVKHV